MTERNERLRVADRKYPCPFRTGGQGPDPEGEQPILVSHKNMRTQNLYLFSKKHFSNFFFFCIRICIQMFCIAGFKYPLICFSVPGWGHALCFVAAVLPGVGHDAYMVLVHPVAGQVNLSSSGCPTKDYTVT